MKTFEKIFISLALLFAIAGKSQTTDWNLINSQNALDMISLQNSNPVASTLYGSQVVQMGNNNNADLQLNAKTNIVIQQLGDQNSIYFNNSFSTKESRSAITTQGNNNIIDITGTNSISEGLHLNIKSDNKTIFMRNY
ncbi:hypothetical protein OF897_19025 [Chryseobacterium formosus]|uniref:Curlin associated repeat-containing protein n=1 Tax=Chryseobacterium formosus TaxID=1537363 RepID=A0ABT3XWL6_9FLAO|nr:hypothetical protein [Chryseobacterium formosus]MCX8526012.1 hypothetical protein [Chryseobacterium formosus]